MHRWQDFCLFPTSQTRGRKTRWMRECVSFATWSTAEECIICDCSDSMLAQCKDISSWTTLYRAVVIRNHKPILEASTESESPESTIKYHRNYRAEFTYKKNLQTNNKPSDDAATGTAPRRSHRDGNQPNPAILPDQRLFCKKSKYEPNTKTREKLHSVQEFRANETVRACASLHVTQNIEMSEVARDVIGIVQRSHFQRSRSTTPPATKVL